MRGWSLQARVFTPTGGGRERLFVFLSFCLFHVRGWSSHARIFTPHLAERGFLSFQLFVRLLDPSTRGAWIRWEAHPPKPESWLQLVVAKRPDRLRHPSLTTASIKQFAYSAVVRIKMKLTSTVWTKWKVWTKTLQELPPLTILPPLNNLLLLHWLRVIHIVGFVLEGFFCLHNVTFFFFDGWLWALFALRHLFQLIIHWHRR